MLALWVKGAISPESAVSSKEVSDELRTRLRGNAPQNTSDVLGKSPTEIERVQGTGRRSRWYLTTSGFRRLQALGLPITVADPAGDTPPFMFDVAFVCALHSPELTALLNAFGGESQWRNGPSSGQPHIYKVTETTNGSGQNLRIIAGAPTYMGLTATAILATQMILLFKPRFIAMVGIAAGTRSGNRGYGDILVADPSVDYASGKVSFTDGLEVFHPDPFPLPINVSLRTIVQEDARTRAGLETIMAAWSGPRPDSDLRVHIGALGAADQVVDSRARVAEVQRNWRKLIGLEMETYALYRAAHEAPQPRPLYASFKAVCDFAAEKTDVWQSYAAFTAARYAKKFVTDHWSVIKGLSA